jgi:hypothetical protein
VKTGPELIRPAESQERNWKPLAIAAGVVIVIVVALIFVAQRRQNSSSVAPVTAAADPYAASLPMSGVTMSESANLAGGKVTYLDGHIANKGNKTVTGITVQVLFRNPAHEVAQNETQRMMLIRTRDPYIDTEPISAAPLKSGDERDFRLSFDTVTPDWDGTYPEIRILRVQTQ